MEKIDLEGALTCAKEFILTEPMNVDYVDEWFKLDVYKKIFEKKIPGFQTFVAHDGNMLDKTIGFIMCSRYMSRVVEIRQHYILREYRNKGVGAALKGYLTNQMAAQHNLLIISDVSKHNKASMRLNEKLNWTRKDLDDETWRYIKKL